MPHNMRADELSAEKSRFLLSIVVPCYNEEESIPAMRSTFLPVVRSLVGSTVGGVDVISDVEVVFVDDGSRDNTAQVLRETFAALEEPHICWRFETHTVNRGLGAALRTGFAAAEGDVVVTTDSDGTYRFETVPALLALLAPGVDIVTASPYAPGGSVENVPGYRLLLSRGSSMLYRLLVDWKVHCYTALFRAYRRDIVKRINFQADGFLAGTELMVIAMLQGAHVVEFPTVLHARAAGVSKAKLKRTIKAHLIFQNEIAAHRLGMATMDQRHKAHSLEVAQ